MIKLGWLNSVQEVIVRLLVKFIFGNSWIFCIFISLVATVVTWFGLENPIQSWNKLLIGFAFGLSIGVINIYESCFNRSLINKIIFGAIVGLFFALLSTFLLDADPVYYLVSSAFGMFLGATARKWSMYINFI